MATAACPELAGQGVLGLHRDGEHRDELFGQVVEGGVDGRLLVAPNQLPNVLRLTDPSCAAADRLNRWRPRRRSVAATRGADRLGRTAAVRELSFAGRWTI